MKRKPAVIKSSRLDLILLQPDLLRLSLAGNATAVEQLLALAVPQDWYHAHELIRIRLQQITAEPAYGPWSLRAISLRERCQISRTR